MACGTIVHGNGRRGHQSLEPRTTARRADLVSGVSPYSHKKFTYFSAIRTFVFMNRHQSPFLRTLFVGAWRRLSRWAAFSKFSTRILMETTRLIVCSFFFMALANE
jgi:hypothetical protein